MRALPRIRYFGFMDKPFVEPCVNLVTSARAAQHVHVLETFRFIGDTLAARRIEAIQSVLEETNHATQSELLVFFDIDRYAFLRKPQRNIIKNLRDAAHHTGRIIVPTRSGNSSFSSIGDFSLFAGSARSIRHVITKSRRQHGVIQAGMLQTTRHISCSFPDMLAAAEGSHACERVPLVDISGAPHLRTSIYSWLTMGSHVIRAREELTYLYGEYPHLIDACGDVSHSHFARIPTYYINLASSHMRKKRMEKQFNRLRRDAALHVHFTPLRVDAVSEDEVRSRIRKGVVQVPDSLKFGTKSILGKQYSFRELACVLSHFKAIELAYQNGDDFALVLEDDVILVPDFFSELQKTLGGGPDDWDIIQLYTLSSSTVSRFRNLRYTQFIQWFPDHWSTSAYLIRRTGMKKLLSMYKSNDNTVFPAGIRTAVADELLYYDVNTYTCTMNAVNIDEKLYLSTVQDGGGIKPHVTNMAYKNAPPKALPDRDLPSTLIFVTERVESSEGFLQIVSLLVANMKALRTFDFAPHWIVYFVFSDNSFMRVADEIFKEKVVANAIFNLEVKFEIIRTRYNKFSLLAKSLAELHLYDCFMMVDGDFDLRGFGWLEAIEYLRKAVIVGSVHESSSEQLAVNAGKLSRQHFKIFDGRWWRNYMPETKAIKVPFIEQGFAMMDARFAVWYFGQVLQKKYIGRTTFWKYELHRSDFGPDMMWCGAANEWLNGKRGTQLLPCVLTTASSIKHTDTRQIAPGFESIQGTVESQELLKIERVPLKKYRADFKRWFDHSDEYILSIGGRWEFEADTLMRLNQSVVDY